MKIVNLYPGSFASASYLVTDDEKSEAYVIDPSADPSVAKARLLGELPRIKGILLTHAHFDHMLALDAWRSFTGAPVMVMAADAPAFTDSLKNGYRYFFEEELTFSPPDLLLEEGQLLPFGAERLRVMHTPGHTKGSCVFDSGEVLFTGDTLFNGGGYGRTDLYGGCTDALWESIRRILLLSGERVVYPGHGSPTRLSLCREHFKHLIV